MSVPAITDAHIRKQWMRKGEEFHRRVGQENLNHLANMYGRVAATELAAKRAASKCPSCGSREFRHHNMVRICSYCRSEA